jgi:hypothetical protein
MLGMLSSGGVLPVLGELPCPRVVARVGLAPSTAVQGRGYRVTPQDSPVQLPGERALATSRLRRARTNKLRTTVAQDQLRGSTVPDYM